MDMPNANGGADYTEQSKTVGLLSAFSGSYDTKTSVRAWAGESDGQGKYNLDITGISDFSDDDVWVHTEMQDGIEFETEYINNEVNIIFDWGTTDEQKIAVFDYIGGELVGGIKGLNEYNVRIPRMTLPELTAYCEHLMEQFDYVYADYDMVHELVENSDARIEPNDPWSTSNVAIDWNEENLSGSNWWLKTIQAPSAWSYSDFFNVVHMGIVDSGFDTEHEDLALLGATEETRQKNNPSNHGTHVAGIIGAIHDNGVGISGVMPNALLRYYSRSGNSKKERDENIYNAIDALAQDGSKVINYSTGIEEMLTDRDIRKYGNKTSKRIGQWLENGKDFIIVQSSGNGIKGKGVDAINNGYFCSIQEENCYSSDKVSKQDIMNRVIIVTASAQSPILMWSANGGKQVDLVAPGLLIYSTVAGIVDTKNEIAKGQKYAELSGTSMAAPIVAGVAGLVWSINPTFTGAQVKDIVVKSNDTWVLDDPNSDTQSPNLNGYRLVNAKLAVEEAIRQTYTTGVLDGAVDDKDTREPLEGAIVTVTSADKSKVLPVKTNSEGRFRLVLPVGDYTVEITHEADGTRYEPYEKNITVTSGVITHLPILLTKQNIGEFATITGKVLEQGTNAPLSGVLVQATKTGSTTVVSSYITNTAGAYVLSVEPNASYDFKFSKSGFEDEIFINIPVIGSSEAKDVVMSPTSEPEFAGGTGTEQDPYLISTPQQLDNVRNNLSAHYKIVNDIDLAAWGNWEPIGNSGNDESTPAFSGTFDGNGHVIKNMTINIIKSALINADDDSIYPEYSIIYAGLFGYTSRATIKNTGIVNSTVNATAYMPYAGGIAGYIGNATISNCYNASEISSNSDGGYAYSGGICGKAFNSQINKCYNLGKVTAQALSTQTFCYAGGITAEQESKTNGGYSIISDCFNRGEIASLANSLFNNQPSLAAGICAMRFYNTTITNSYNSGLISASSTNNQGGHVEANGIYADYANGQSITTNCYSLQANFSHNYLDYNGNILQEDEMRQQSFFVGFDFDTIWAISPTINNGYPYLQGMQP
jgi:subtilisin family serine protease